MSPSASDPLISESAPAHAQVPSTVPCSPDALLGIIWWNRISRAERAHWLEVAGSYVPAEAWAAFKSGGRS